MMHSDKISDRDILRHLTPEQISAIHASSRIVYCEPGENLYEKGDMANNFFIVMEGKVALYLDIGSEDLMGEICVDEVTDGGICGLSATFPMQSYYLTAKCVEFTKVLAIDSHSLRRVMENDLQLAYTLQSLISEAYFKRYAQAMAQAVTSATPFPVGREGFPDTMTYI